MTHFFSHGPMRWVATLAAISALVLSGCSISNDGDNEDNGEAPSNWTWTELGGPDAQVSPLAANHEPLVVIGSQLLLGTRDGVWRRPLEGTATWERSGLDGFAVHALKLTRSDDRIIAVGMDFDDEQAPTAWYSTDEGQTWTPASSWPRGAPGTPFEGFSFPFHSLELDPDDDAVIYGGMTGDTVAVSVDAGATWVITDGATEPSFGDACVPHRPEGSSVLLQGCELPLDTAWVGARSVIEEDRFSLPDFRFLYGYPDTDQLENRRINAMTGLRDRDDVVLVGVEGGLLELTSASGEWIDRDDVTGRWVMQATQGSGLPYAYIRAIATLDDDGDHLLFGGPLNGDNDTVSLFETSNGGVDVHVLTSPLTLFDPRIEQAWRLDDRDVLLVISVLDSASTDPSTPHSPKVYRLQR